MRVGFGAEPLGGTDWGDVDFGEAERAVRRALDLGVTVFDTADVYGLGESERRLGRALGTDRNRVRIVSKGGVRWSGTSGRAETRRDASPAYLRAAVEASLERLGVETIPLYFLHWPDPTTPLEESVLELERLRSRGWIGAWGLSNHSREDLVRACTVGSPAAVEVAYSAVEPERASTVIEEAALRGLEVFTYGALAQGLLTGRYRRGHAFPATDRRSRLPHFRPDSPAWSVVEKMLHVAKELDRPPLSVALRWVLEDERVTCAIVGARSVRQIDEIVASIEGWSLCSLRASVRSQVSC